MSCDELLPLVVMDGLVTVRTPPFVTQMADSFAPAAEMAGLVRVTFPPLCSYSAHMPMDVTTRRVTELLVTLPAEFVMVA